jgi:uncharacterized protein GlcG (DUF336 family)
MRALEAGLQKAEEIGSPSSVAILDAGGNLVAFARQDNSLLGSIQVSQNKAFTACAFRFATGDLQGAVQPGGPFYSLEGAHGRPLVFFAGGLPVTIDGGFAGGVGAAGGTPEQDLEVAQAAASAITGGG